MVAGLVVIVSGSCALAADPSKTVTNDDQAKAALSAAAPGQTIVFADGEYDLQHIQLTCEATQQQPLIIRAEHVGRAKLVGTSVLQIVKSSYVTIEGFRFESDDNAVVHILGSHHIRVTRNHFQLRQPEGATRTHAITTRTGAGENHRPHWLEIGGIAEGQIHSHDNRIDHNQFQDKHTIGNFISLVGYNAPPFQVSQHDRIDHNYFCWIGPRISNGMEAIRAGLSYLSMSEGGTIIEQNLFENCDGDPEIVSVKECGGVVRNNTFVNCEGGVCLRHGNHSEVSGNFFFGNGKRGTDGIRPYGDDDRIFNNYFEGLTAPALHLANGDFDYGHGELENRELLKQHFRPRRLLVAFNTMVDCDVPIQIGAGGKKEFAIEDLTMANNLVVGGGKQKIVDLVNAPTKATWLGNVVSSESPLGVELPEDQLRVVKMSLTKDAGLQRPGQDSPVVDAAAGEFGQIKLDMDGQQRVGKYDVGADEVSSAPVVNRPLTPADVGPMAPGD